MGRKDEHDHSRIDDLFARHGLRCTRQRRAIYEALAASKAHPSADQIFRQVRPHQSGVSLATVYNTLEAFCQAGLAQKLARAASTIPGPAAGTGPARYDATTRSHLHLHCTRTGQILDVPEDLGQELRDRIPHGLLERIESELGVKIQDVRIELVGSRGEQ